jgi:hypothetical protein
MALATTLVPNGSAGAVYTSTISGSQIGNAITCMMICNTSSSVNATLTLYAIPNGGSVGANTMIINALNIPFGETVSLDQEKLVLGSGDAIYGLSSVASILTFAISTLPV